MKEKRKNRQRQRDKYRVTEMMKTSSERQKGFPPWT